MYVCITDGVALCNLLELLSNSSLKRWNTKPIMKAQRLDNLNLAFDFMGRQKGLTLVNIRPTGEPLSYYR